MAVGVCPDDTADRTQAVTLARKDQLISAQVPPATDQASRAHGESLVRNRPRCTIESPTIRALITTSAMGKPGGPGALLLAALSIEWRGRPAHGPASSAGSTDGLWRTALLSGPSSLLTGSSPALPPGMFIGGHVSFFGLSHLGLVYFSFNPKQNNVTWVQYTLSLVIFPS